MTGKKAQIKQNNEPRVYNCHHPSCDKVFLDRSSYKKHLFTHGEKQFICQAENCNKRFLDNSKLKRHMLVHTGEKAYKCELCNKRFSLDFNLRTHLRIHTGEKPYVCFFENCYKRFSQSSNLSAHEKTHFLPKEEGGLASSESQKHKEEEIGLNKKRIFKISRPSIHVQRPKPVLILDRHRYLENLKKNEEEKKKIEEEKLKADNEKENVSLRAKEDAEIININSINIKNDKDESLIKDNKTSLISSKNITEINDNFKNKLKNEQFLREKAELNSLLTNLNRNNDDLTSRDTLAAQLEFIVPYYLTREWVLKNLNIK